MLRSFQERQKGRKSVGGRLTDDVDEKKKKNKKKKKKTKKKKKKKEKRERRGVCRCVPGDAVVAQARS